MSNIAFQSGDYYQQENLFNTSSQDGLIYINPHSRTIAIGEENGYVNFNSLMNNDDNELVQLNDYTNSSVYILNNKIRVDNDSKIYYSVDKATHKIGATNSSMVNGYITKKLDALVSGIPYESNNFTYEMGYERMSGSGWYLTTKQYTFPYPHTTNLTRMTNYKYLIIFCNTLEANEIDAFLNVNAYIYKLTELADVQISYQTLGDLPMEDDELPSVYKAFWI